MHLARPPAFALCFKTLYAINPGFIILSPYLVGIQHPNPFLNVYKKWACMR